jgi:hypothetical protein
MSFFRWLFGKKSQKLVQTQESQPPSHSTAKVLKKKDFMMQPMRYPPSVSQQIIGRGKRVESAMSNPSQTDDSFAVSMMMAAAVNDGVVGGLIGGNMAGGIIGDMLTPDETPSAPAESTWDNHSPRYDHSPSYDTGPSYDSSPSYDSGSSYDCGSSCGGCD